VVACHGQTGDAVRELLSLYADLNDPASQRQIQGIGRRPPDLVVRRLSASGPPSFGRGVEITRECADAAFEGTSAFLLEMVMTQFFAPYVSLGVSVHSDLIRPSSATQVPPESAPRGGRRNACPNAPRKRILSGTCETAY
jgi:type VI secretion system protein ImpG